jgi:hypothetical protein
VIIGSQLPASLHRQSHSPARAPPLWQNRVVPETHISRRIPAC